MRFSSGAGSTRPRRPLRRHVRERAHGGLRRRGPRRRRRAASPGRAGRRLHGPRASRVRLLRSPRRQAPTWPAGTCRVEPGRVLSVGLTWEAAQGSRHAQAPRPGVSPPAPAPGSWSLLGTAKEAKVDWPRGRGRHPFRSADARGTLRRGSRAAGPTTSLRSSSARRSSAPARADEIEDVYLGCANQAGEDNRNVARMAALLAGLPESVPASRSTGSARPASRRSSPPATRSRPGTATSSSPAGSSR